MRSRVVYQKLYSQCNNARYVGQTVRHITTKLKEHTKDAWPLGTYLTYWGVDTVVQSSKVEILGKRTEKQKILTLICYFSKTR